MTTRIPLKVVAAPAAGVILKAPAVLKASEHSVDFTCGRCGAVLLHADEGQVHGILTRALIITAEATYSFLSRLG